MAMTPQTIAKAAIQEMVSLGKDAKYATERMIDVWQDAFPLVRYLDDAGALEAKRKKERKKEPPKKTPVDVLKADLAFNEVWGGDIADDTAYAGLAMEFEGDEVPDVPTFDIHAHKTEGLTRSQLARTGFQEHGGVVLTLLNPMLVALDAKVQINSHVYFGAQLYRIAEMKPLVNWELYGGPLYTAVNCVV